MSSSAVVVGKHRLLKAGYLILVYLHASIVTNYWGKVRYTYLVVIGFFFRSAWRLLVLGLGIGLAYLSAFIAFPYLDSQFPFFIALLLVYIGVAYFGMPTLMRTWRLIIRPNHIPLYVTTRDGLPSDPVNIAIVAKSKRHLIKTMKAAGWHTADKATLRNMMLEGYAILFNKPYPNAPFSNLYLFNRPFDVGFQIPYGKNGSPRHRHHVRFWQLLDLKEDHGHFRFWAKHFRRFVGKERAIWIGAAIDDVNPFGIRWYNLQVTHSTHPLHHHERDFLIKTLEDTGAVKSTSEAKAGDPFQIRSQQIGVNFVCDGRLSVVELKN
jgi:hypothetical protein